jgi:hypothetical protein
VHELSPESASAIGLALVKVSARVVQATGTDQYNVLVNNGKDSGQVIATLLLVFHDFALKLEHRKFRMFTSTSFPERLEITHRVGRNLSRELEQQRTQSRRNYPMKGNSRETSSHFETRSVAKPRQIRFQMYR